MFLALLLRVSVDDMRFIKFFIISFPVIFERFFLRVREPREEKRREEKRRTRKTRTRLFSWKRRAEDLKKKKSGKRKDNRSPLVCLSRKVFGDESKHQNLFSSSLFCFPPNNKNRTHTNENETTYDANRRCRRR